MEKFSLTQEQVNKMEIFSLTQEKVDIINYLLYQEILSDNNLISKNKLREILKEFSKFKPNSENQDNSIQTFKNPSEGKVYFDYFDPPPESVFFD